MTMQDDDISISSGPGSNDTEEEAPDSAPSSNNQGMGIDSEDERMAKEPTVDDTTSNNVTQATSSFLLGSDPEMGTSTSRKKCKRGPAPNFDLEFVDIQIAHSGRYEVPPNLAEEYENLPGMHEMVASIPPSTGVNIQDSPVMPSSNEMDVNSESAAGSHIGPNQGEPSQHSSRK
ncbi:hypothetical protein BDP27DRAFT_1366661 [Rhodocollybia butyracea]|uniref:Uncharacterized protein n=1 Tax=Rhodocollybia butyracea TaxID=206335 RepID=A0A9P5PKW4_9AGAR|nr:hypothetical protein BDP27DRAFT_1366661 [Rhodocollybia butyracea]